MSKSDKRKHRRYACSIKTNFKFYTGNPDDFDMSSSTPEKGKGVIMDISCGGVLIATNSRVSAAMPIILSFKMNKEDYKIQGKIVRTGLLKNNPSEIAQKFKLFSGKGDLYIAVEFDTPISDLKFEHLKK
jgi:hypothetical protein